MKTLVVVAHLDDESLSCGGLLSRCEDPFVLVVYGRKYVGESVSDNERSMSAELNDFLNALKVLDVKNYRWLNLPEGEPHQTGYYQVLEEVERLLLKHKFDEIVFPSEHDLNQDHRMLSDIMKIVCRPGNLGSVRRVLKSLSHDSMMVSPQYFVPLSKADIDRKLEAVSCYKREARDVPHPRCLENILALARIHGSKCGHEFAEGYEVHMIREFV